MDRADPGLCELRGSSDGVVPVRTSPPGTSPMVLAARQPASRVHPPFAACTLEKRTDVITDLQGGLIQLLLEAMQ